MVKVIKKFILILLLVGAFYMVLSNHFFFFGRNVKMVEKSSLTFEYTFVSVKPTDFRGPEEILRIPELRQDGVGDVLVEFGIITDAELYKLEQKIDNSE